MAKKQDQVNTNDVSLDQEYEAYLASFEDGVSVERPILEEGVYPALFTSFTYNFGMTSNGPTAKKSPDGLADWAMLGGTYKLDSASARSQLGTDNDPTIRVGRGSKNDAGCSSFPGNLQLHSKFGITLQGNEMFWNFLGKLFEQIGLAEHIKNSEGKSAYKFDSSIIASINSGVIDKWKELTQLVENGEPISTDTAKNDARLIPAMLAEFQLSKINELLQPVDGDTTLQKSVVWVGVKGRRDNSDIKDNYIKDYRFWSEIADTLTTDDLGTTFTLNVKNNEAVFELNV